MTSNEIDLPAHPRPPTASCHPKANNGGGSISSSRPRASWLLPSTRTTRPSSSNPSYPAAPSAINHRLPPHCAQTQRRSSAPPDSSDPRVHRVVTDVAVSDGAGLGSAGGGGGPIWLDEREAKRIRAASASATPVGSKNSMRRAGSTGEQSCSKRARRAAAGSDDDDREFSLGVCVMAECASIVINGVLSSFAGQMGLRGDGRWGDCLDRLRSWGLRNRTWTPILSWTWMVNYAHHQTSRLLQGSAGPVVRVSKVCGAAHQVRPVDPILSRSISNLAWTFSSSSSIRHIAVFYLPQSGVAERGGWRERGSRSRFDTRAAPRWRSQGRRTMHDEFIRASTGSGRVCRRRYGRSA
jgi:hypothetical protein